VTAVDFVSGIGPAPLWILLGALLAVEQVSFAQLQLAHAFVAGGLAGLLAGDPFTGALLGGVLGLVLSGHRPVGGVIPPDAGIGAVIAVLSWELSPEPSGRALLLALLRTAEAFATPRAVRRAVAAALALAALRGGASVGLALVLAPPVLARLEPGGPSPVAILALVAGVGLAAQERLLGSRRWRGLGLALGAAAAVLQLVPGGIAGLGGGR
jgi:hypothetical protein